MVALTREQHSRRLARGLGGGEGAEYKPYLGIRDVPSRGIRTRQVGRTSNRMHVAMSELERMTLMILQRVPGIVQIKEQFPLPLDETDIIAAELGVRPPTFAGKPVVLTTDLVALFAGPNGTWREAVAVKPREALQKKRARELLDIEQMWWSRAGVRWRMVTEAELPQAVARNLIWIDDHFDIYPGMVSGATVEDIAADLLGRLRAALVPLFMAAQQTDQCFGQEDGTSLSIFRHMLARRRWSVPMTKIIDTLGILDPAQLVVLPLEMHLKSARRI